MTCEGESIRILGGRIGNNTLQQELWTPILEKIQSRLLKCSTANPTLEAKRHYVQVTVGTCTQYATSVSGMPLSIVKELNKMQRHLMWNGSASSQVGCQTLQKELSDGGKCLFDIQTQNEAIDLVNLRTLLCGRNRTFPVWTYIAKSILNAHPLSSDNLDSGAAINPFLQKWTPKSRNLPFFLQSMVNTARKYGITFAGIRPTQTIRNSLPIWHHIYEDTKKRQIHQGQKSHCLCHTVGDAVKISTHLHQPDHEGTNLCECFDCVTDRTVNKCPNPHACATATKRKLDGIQPAWDPRCDTLPPPAQAPLTRHAAPAHNTESVLFDPDLTLSTLENGFRTFTKWDNLTLVHIPPPPRCFIPPTTPTHLDLYLASKTVTPLNGKPHTGCSVVFGLDDPRNQFFRLPNDLDQLSSTGILFALYQIITPDLSFTCSNTIVKLYLNNRIIFNFLAGSWKNWDYFSCPISPTKTLARSLLSHLRSRRAPLELHYLPPQHLVELTFTHISALEGANLPPVTDSPIFPIVASTHLRGITLNTLTQKIAHRGLRQIHLNNSPQWRMTTHNILSIQTALCNLNMREPTPRDIWLSIRKPVFTPKLHNFFYITIHGGQCIGPWWKNISGYEDRQNCTHCASLDTMEHILTQCKKPGQQVAWNLAQTLWGKRTSTPWPNPSIGLIFGCGLVRLAGNDKPLSRFYCILLSETAHFIWKLRCETLVSRNDAPASNMEIHNCWVHTINERLALDRLMATTHMLSCKSVSPNLFAHTWCGTLLHEEKLPEDWITKRETFSGY